MNRDVASMGEAMTAVMRGTGTTWPAHDQAAGSW